MTDNDRTSAIATVQAAIAATNIVLQTTLESLERARVDKALMHLDLAREMLNPQPVELSVDDAMAAFLAARDRLATIQRNHPTGIRTDEEQDAWDAMHAARRRYMQAVEWETRYEPPAPSFMEGVA